MITLPQWQEMLVGLMPDYLKHKKLCEEGPELFLSCYKKGNFWNVRIEEELHGTDRNLIDTSMADNNLATHIEWAIAQLENWPNVRRTSYDTWQFRKKRDAEKFLTVFHLSWEQ